MTPAPSVEVYLDEQQAATQLRTEAIDGLTSQPKWLSPRWLYDATGSELFEKITALPEYYPFRAEREILAEQAHVIADLAAPQTLVELGSGSSEKTRLLLSALVSRGSLRRFVPQDVSASALRGAVAELAPEYPDLRIQGVVSDFTSQLHLLPEGGSKLVAFLGGTIGNFTPEQRSDFLAAVRAELSPGEHLLLGTDLVKAPEVLLPAYDDAAGVTAEFNRNVLRVLNTTLEANFDVEEFSHSAVWNSQQERIEMWLHAGRDMQVRVADLDLTVRFRRGEGLRSEVSSKFRRDGVAAELERAGFQLQRWMTDSQQRFALSLAVAG